MPFCCNVFLVAHYGDPLRLLCDQLDNNHLSDTLKLKAPEHGQTSGSRSYNFSEAACSEKLYYARSACLIPMISADGQCGKTTAVKICKCTYSLNTVRNVSETLQIFRSLQTIGSDAGNALASPDLYLSGHGIRSGDFFLICHSFMAPVPANVGNSVFIKAQDAVFLLRSTKTALFFCRMVSVSISSMLRSPQMLLPAGLPDHPDISSGMSASSFPELCFFGISNILCFRSSVLPSSSDMSSAFESQIYFRFCFKFLHLLLGLLYFGPVIDSADRSVTVSIQLLLTPSH